MLLDITPLSESLKGATSLSLPVIVAIYVICTMAISKLYVVQAYKFLRGKNGAGDFCFRSKISQALLRTSALLYATYINDGTLFLVVALDFVGRWVEILAAHVAYLRFSSTGRAVLDEAMPP